MNNKLNIDYNKLIGEGGHYKTKAIFHDFKYMTGSEYTPYTLRERDHPDGAVSMYRIYMDCETEYEASQVLLNSWKHWEILVESTWFQPYITKWREERDIRDAALAKKTLLEEAKDGNVNAAKAVYDQATKRKAGRPSKQEVEGHKKKLAASDSKIANIVDRMSKYDNK